MFLDTVCAVPHFVSTLFHMNAALLFVLRVFGQHISGFQFILFVWIHKMWTWFMETQLISLCNEIPI